MAQQERAGGSPRFTPSIFGAAGLALAAGVVLLLMWIEPGALLRPSSYLGPVGIVLASTMGALAWGRASRAEQRRLARLLRAQAEVQGRIDRLPLLIYGGRDVQRRLELVTGGATSLTGASPEEMMRGGSDLESFIVQEDRARVRRELQPVIEVGGSFRIQYRILRRDGSVVPVEDVGVVARGAGGVSVLEGFVIDASALEELQAQLREARRLETLGKMAGGIAHDLNNMLTAAQMSAELLGRMEIGEGARREAEAIRSVVSSGAELVRQLSVVGRPSGDGSQVIRLCDIIRLCKPIFRRLMKEDVRLDVELRATFDQVRAVRSELQQLVLNLVVNAGEAVDPGGRISIETTDVTITDGSSPLGLPPGDYARLVVEDDGRGMDARTRDRIFEPLFSTKQRTSGGLGMSIVRAVVRHSDGTIFVDSEPGRGTTVTVYFPRAEVDRERAGVA